MVNAQELVANGTITSCNIDTVFCLCVMVLDILHRNFTYIISFDLYKKQMRQITEVLLYLLLCCL